MTALAIIAGRRNMTKGFKNPNIYGFHEFTDHSITIPEESTFHINSEKGEI
jgi:hypothetical protein